MPPLRVVAQPDDARHHPFAVAGDTVTEHVAREHDEPEGRVASCLTLGVIVEAGTAVDDQDPRPLSGNAPSQARYPVSAISPSR